MSLQLYSLYRHTVQYTVQYWCFVYIEKVVKQKRLNFVGDLLFNGLFVCLKKKLESQF